MSNIFALIPARGGSKGIKGKNIVPLAAKPLLVYSIDAARESGVINDIYVSSDDVAILSVAENHGAKIISRNKSLAQDETPTNPVIEDFILRQQLMTDDIIILLQPTSPLRKAWHIKEALEQFNATPDCSALISVAEIDRKYLYSFVINEKYLQPVAEKYIDIPRRQELPSLYLPNGALYIFKVGDFLAEKSIPRKNIAAYVMEQKYSIDIDTHDDLIAAERFLSEPATISDKQDE